MLSFPARAIGMIKRGSFFVQETLANVGNPSLITSPAIKAWYKGSAFDSTADGTEVTAWNDSANAFNLSNIGAAADRPTVHRNAINSNMTAVQCVGKRGLVSIALTLTAYNNWTIFAVLKFTAEAATNNEFFQFNDGLAGNATFDTRLARTPAAKFQGLSNSGGGNWLQTNTFSLNVWHYVMFRNNGGTITLWVDGVSQAISSPGAQSANPGAIKLFQGKDAAGSYPFVEIAELVLYNGPITDADKSANLEAYARAKFGLT